jgi:archaellum component FlaG (FlaF/FlaG flagellin family)
MASAIIGEGVMIIASVIVAGALAGVVLNQVGVFESTIAQTTDSQQEKMLTKVKIVYASNSTDNVVDVWIKNTGKNPVTSTTNMDVFFGEIDQVTRYAYDAPTAFSDNTWDFASGSAPTVWQVLNTTQIEIDESSLQKDVTYVVRVTTPNGIFDEYIFSLP